MVDMASYLPMLSAHLELVTVAFLSSALFWLMVILPLLPDSSKHVSLYAYMRVKFWSITCVRLSVLENPWSFDASVALADVGSEVLV